MSYSAGQDGYSVGRVAGVTGVTVRTLHHYDEIGLLVPSERSRAGHRRYSAADLDRLRQVLFYRELGFPLDEVAALLDDPETDPRARLRRQHELLTDRIEKLRRMAEAVEQAAMGLTDWAPAPPAGSGATSSATRTPSGVPRRRKIGGATPRRTRGHGTGPFVTPRTPGSGCRPRSASGPRATVS